MWPTTQKNPSKNENDTKTVYQEIAEVIYAKIQTALAL